MQFIVRGVHERDSPMFSELTDFAKLLTVQPEFRSITPVKLVPADWVVPKPFS